MLMGCGNFVVQAAERKKSCTSSQMVFGYKSDMKEEEEGITLPATIISADQYESHEKTGHWDFRNTLLSSLHTTKATLTISLLLSPMTQVTSTSHLYTYQVVFWLFLNYEIRTRLFRHLSPARSYLVYSGHKNIC